jgi:hypothetical protein
VSNSYYRSGNVNKMDDRIQMEWNASDPRPVGPAAEKAAVRVRWKMALLSLWAISSLQ